MISFLEEDVLRLTPFAAPPPPAQSAAAAIKQDVKRWYDEFGWKRAPSGQYGDTALFSQLGMSANEFYEMASRLSILPSVHGGRVLPRRGKRGHSPSRVSQSARPR